MSKDYVAHVDHKRKRFLKTVHLYRTGLVSRQFMARTLREQRKTHPNVYHDYWGKVNIYETRQNAQPSGSWDVKMVTRTSRKTPKRPSLDELERFILR